MNGVDESLLPLFQMEAESQCVVLNEGLLALEASADASDTLNALMRAAHSMKGAAAVVGLSLMVQLAHAMEDCFTACIQDKRSLPERSLADLLAATDVMAHLAVLQPADFTPWQQEQEPTIHGLIERLQAWDGVDEGVANAPESSPSQTDEAATAKSATQDTLQPTPQSMPSGQQKVRLSAERLDALMALTGEVQLSAHDIQPIQQELGQVQQQLAQVSESLRVVKQGVEFSSQGMAGLQGAEQVLQQCRGILGAKLDALYQFERKMGGISQRLSYEVLDIRMQKFGDAVPGFRRLVHDTAQTLHKKVRLKVSGADCDIDRDIMEKIQAPLQHILRNAVDHGVEPADIRRMCGKPEEAEIHIQVRHQGGRLLIQVCDDGGGIHWENLRQSIVDKGLSTHEMVAEMDEQELLDFLLLPQFSLKQDLSEISGRGVGLDLVANAIRVLRGQLMVHSEEGSGSRFEMHLPLSLSIARCLLLQVSEETYAIHLSRISAVCTMPQDALYAVEGCPCVRWRDESVPVLSAAQVLGHEVAGQGAMMALVFLPWHQKHYALWVDAFLGEDDIIEKAMDERFGDINNISGGAVDAQGHALLVLDVDDVLLSMQQLVEQGHWKPKHRGQQTANAVKSILVVEDSMTVREAERRMLEHHGYQVHTAVDGMDGWHALRMQDVDLVISDIDMPRMNGIGLLKLIRAEEAYRTLPVMIVSYKDREEDRMAGLQAGANYYLTKSSFHDDTMLQGVRDLIGEANDARNDT